MKFTDFVCMEAIQPNLAAFDKEGIIRELTGALVAAGAMDDQGHENIVQRILERERLGTTGIGRGVAVPHAKHDGVERTVGTVGISQDGVDFESLDGAHVRVIFLLISPTDQSERHLQVLETISSNLRDDMFCKFLTQSTTADEIRQVLEDIDQR